MNELNPKRIELIEILGGMFCKECGNNDERVLQIDHIFGNGKEMPLNKTGIIEYYLENCDIACEELQVLCANCHLIKTIENGDRYNRRIKYDDPSLDLSILKDNYEIETIEKIRCNLMKEFLETS